MYKNLTPGKNPPHNINVMIEIPMNSDPVKYEFDKESGLMFVDRIMPTSMFYPCNYGFIPHTLSGDGDPVDVLLLTSFPLIAKSVAAARPIGVLFTEDEKGTDEKLLAVPMHNVDLTYYDINSYKDLPSVMIKKIEHFFQNYKNLESDKWVKINGWGDEKAAEEIIQQGIKRYNENV